MPKVIDMMNFRSVRSIRALVNSGPPGGQPHLTAVVATRPVQPARRPEGPSATDRLAVAAAAFAAACADAEGTATPRAAVASAEAVSTTRDALYQCLIDLGWEPPPGVVAGMSLDAQLLLEGLGAAYDEVPGSRMSAALLRLTQRPT